jgi:hypothetical protein
MAKHDDQVSAYPCMMPPAHLRRVHDPSEERRVTARGRLRRALASLAAGLRP